jgi:hypothetical protein
LSRNSDVGKCTYGISLLMFAFTCAVFFGTQTDRGYFTLASLVLMILFSVAGGYLVSDGFSSFLHDLKKE